MKTIKVFDIVKTTIYLVLLVIVLLIYKNIGYNANYVVGSTMIIHSIFGVLDYFIKKGEKQVIPKFVYDISILALGIVLLFINGNNFLVLICLIWAIWSILREINEILTYIFTKNEHIVLKILGFIESIVSTFFAVLLIIHPSLEHLEIHYILLVVEFATTAIFPLINKILQNKSVEKS